MRIYVIHPGAPFSTSDVYDGLVAGLRAQDGVDLYEGRLDSIFTWYELAWRAGIDQHLFHTPHPDAGRGARWASAHITQHILDVWPDLVIAVSGGNYHTKDALALKRCGIRTAVLLTESPYFLDTESLIARAYTMAFTHERAAVDHIRRAQPRTTYLPHAYHPQIHTAGIPPDPAKVCDACFIGSVFAERAALFDGVDWDGLTFVRRGYELQADTRDIVANIEVADYYRSARINLNPHRTTTMHGSGQHIAYGEAESLNPRAYEIAACGGFQLMDDSRPERFDVFGDFAPVYRAGDSADLEEKIRMWLGKPDRREETARAMHAAVQPHSWVQRAAQLVEAAA